MNLRIPDNPAESYSSPEQRLSALKDVCLECLGGTPLLLNENIVLPFVLKAREVGLKSSDLDVLMAAINNSRFADVRDYMTIAEFIAYTLDEMPFQNKVACEALLNLENERIPEYLGRHWELIKEVAGPETVNNLFYELITSRVGVGDKFSNILNRAEIIYIFQHCNFDSYMHVTNLLTLLYGLESDLQIPQQFLTKLLDASLNFYGQPHELFATLQRFKKQIGLQHFYRFRADRDSYYHYGEVAANLDLFGGIPENDLTAFADVSGHVFFFNLDRVTEFYPYTGLANCAKSLRTEGYEDYYPAIVDFSLQSYRYETIRRLALLSSAEDILPFLDIDKLVVAANEHFKNGNYTLAHSALKLISLFTDLLHNDIGLQFNEDSIPSMKGSSPLVKYASVDLLKTAVDFYIKEGLLASLQLQEYEHLNPSGIDTVSGLVSEQQEFARISDRIQFMTLKNKMLQDTVADSSWALTYLVIAIGSELKHQYDCFAYQHLAVPFNMDNIFNMTREELYVFFHQARIIFEHSGWMKYFGGEKWARIAELGEQVTVSDEAMKHFSTYLLDRLYDIQHNTGGVFDKDWRLKPSTMLPFVLDAKHSSTNVLELISRLRAMGVVSQEDHDQYFSLATKVERLKHASKKARGYE